MDVLDHKMWTAICNKYGYPLVPLAGLELYVVFIKYAWYNEE